MNIFLLCVMRVQHNPLKIPGVAFVYIALENTIFVANKFNSRQKVLPFSLWIRNENLSPQTGVRIVDVFCFCFVFCFVFYPLVDFLLLKKTGFLLILTINHSLEEYFLKNYWLNFIIQMFQNSKLTGHKVKIPSKWDIFLSISGLCHFSRLQSIRYVKNLDAEFRFLSAHFI